jgi:hypothetical protein
MGTTRDGTAVHACLEMGETIEEAAQTEANFPPWLLDVLKMKAETSGRLTLVYTVGGPHVELRLGDGSPKVIARCGGETHTAPVYLDEAIVEVILEAHWALTMESALHKYR